MSSVVERVNEIVQPIVHGAGLDVYDLTHESGVLRVLLQGEGENHGVDLDLIGTVTRAISVALDDEDPIPGNYTLEVSSPGLERPLRSERHFADAVGELVTVRTRPGPDGRQRHRGVLVAAGPDGISIEPEGNGSSSADGDTIDLPYDQIDSARTVFEWGPAPKPGKGPGAKQGKHGAGSQKKKAAR